MYRRTSVALVAALVLLAFERPAPGVAQIRKLEDARVAELRQLVEDGYYREAEERGRELQEELCSTRAEGGLAAAEASQWLAAALRRTQSPRSEETLRCARQSVERKRELLGDDDPSYAVALKELATLFITRGEAQPARELLEQALAIQERHSNAAEIGHLFVLIGACGLLTRDLALAESSYRQASKALDGLPEGRLWDSWRLEGEAILGEHRKDYEATLAKLREMLAVREQVLRPDHPLVGKACYDVARVLDLQGNCAQAREYLERAIPILEENFGAGHQRLFSPLFLLGRIQECLGAEKRAEQTYEHALEVGEAAEALPCLLRLAICLTREGGERSKGLEVYRRYFDRCRQLGASSNLADGLVFFGGGMERGGDLEAAAKAYGEAHRILDQKPDGDRSTWARLLSNESSLDLKLGRVTEALDSARRSLEIQEELLGPDHIQLIWPLLNLSRAQLLDGDPESSFASAARVERISRRDLLASLDALEGSLATRYAAEARTISQAALSMVLECAADDPGRSEWVFDAFLRRRGLVLDEMAMRARFSHEEHGQEVERLEQDLRAARAKLANLVHQTDSRSADYRLRVDRAREELEGLERSLAQTSRTYGERQARDALGLREVRQNLPPGVVLVATFVALERAGEPDELPVYLAFVLPAPDAPVRVVRLGTAAEIDTDIGRWRAELLRLDAGAEERVREAGRRIRERIWDPVLAMAGDARRVLLVPDGALHLLSFAALPGSEGRYLIEEPLSVSYLTAERELVRAKQPGKPGQGLLAVGSSAPGGLPQGSLPALVNAQQEAREVAEFWKGQAGSEASDVRLLIGEQATEEAVQHEAAGRRALHIACHGFSRRSSPPESQAARGDWKLARLPPTSAGAIPPAIELEWSPLLEQGLLLAPSRGKTGEDGFLSAEELSGYDLTGVEWAVLAACSTGEGRIETGEGVFGLQRALHLAGVRTTVTTLWPVEDTAARDWTREFYAACIERGRSAAEASEEAARALLQRRRSEGKSTHPFFWAAFIATGGCDEDWRQRK